MTDYANDAAWKEKLSQAVFGFYLDHGAPARFYIRDCVSNKLLDYIEPGLANKYGAVAAYVNVGKGDINLKNRDFVLFTTGGIVTYSAESVNFRSWDKLAKYYADNKPNDGDETSCRNLTAQIAKKIAPSLVSKCHDLSELMLTLVSCALRMLVGLERLPPTQLPYLPFPSEGKSEDKAGPSPATATPTPPLTLNPKTETEAKYKYQVDF